jgi:hypothetical protein
VVLEKLALAKWLMWQKKEIEALQTFFHAAFDEALQSREDANHEIDSWICGLALAGVDVAPFLRKLEDPTVESTLFGFFELNAGGLNKGKLGNSFWNGHFELSAPVINWFESPEIQSLIWKHYGSA